ncbi:hypothetical protein TNIN_87761 [Trichonephila inaurata madagascariensis]|uniref:Serine proteinase stubble n=1 Tax=Trichonephila inaurata madagascariensis TaxID=2747483 RepID=A0A8X7CKR0_9ARAC|nr:hypothetical protein TNIN_87761 [Trichonephila inaurata madagascariensis]
MGLWHRCFYLVLFLIVSAERKNFTLRHSDRRGKALKISKKPCSDPIGRKGICTFKWDCINHNGTLMGTCMDGFIFGTCCQYDYDPLLHEDSLDDGNNYIYDDHRNVYSTPTRYATTRPSTQSTPIRIIYSTTRHPTTITSRRPVTTTNRSTVSTRPVTTSPTTTTTTSTTTRRPTVTASGSSPTGQLVTWSSVSPTRRPQPIPQRPIIISPFPFRPGLNFGPSQGAWPVGIAFPVDPFQINRPIQVFRPPGPLQTAQSQVSNQTVPLRGSNFTILNGADNAAQRNTTLSVAITTVSVPIPQWSTASSPRVTTNHATTLTSPRPFLYASGSSSSSIKTTASTTKRPNLDYRRDCGVRALGPKGRIVGGQSAYFGRWPWQVVWIECIIIKFNLVFVEGPGQRGGLARSVPKEQMWGSLGFFEVRHNCRTLSARAISLFAGGDPGRTRHPHQPRVPPTGNASSEEDDCPSPLQPTEFRQRHRTPGAGAPSGLQAPHLAHLPAGTGRRVHGKGGLRYGLGKDSSRWCNTEPIARSPGADYEKF